MYIQRNIEVRSRNRCCHGKAVNSAVLIIKHANTNALYYIANSGLSGSAIFFHIISNTARFSEESYTTYNVCFDIPYNFFQKHFSF
jgi:hypothetical protein